MDWDILEAMATITVIAGFVTFCIIWGLVVFVLSLYAAAYTVALFHILFVEPMIFNTNSLFTIPYNKIWAMANMHLAFYWIVTLVYIMGGFGFLGEISGMVLKK